MQCVLSSHQCDHRTLNVLSANISEGPRRKIKPALPPLRASATRLGIIASIHRRWNRIAEMEVSQMTLSKHLASRYQYLENSLASRDRYYHFGYHPNHSVGQARLPIRFME